MLGTKNFDRMRNHLVWPAPWSQLHLGTCPGPQKLVRGKVSDGQLPKAKSVSDADSFLHALVLFVCSLLPSTKLWSGRQLHLHGWTLTTGLPWWFGTNSRFRAGIVVTLAKNWVFQTIMVTLYMIYIHSIHCNADIYVHLKFCAFSPHFGNASVFGQINRWAILYDALDSRYLGCQLKRTVRVCTLCTAYEPLPLTPRRAGQSTSTDMTVMSLCSCGGDSNKHVLELDDVSFNQNYIFNGW